MCLYGLLSGPIIGVLIQGGAYKRSRKMFSKKKIQNGQFSILKCNSNSICEGSFDNNLNCNYLENSAHPYTSSLVSLSLTLFSI